MLAAGDGRHARLIVADGAGTAHRSGLLAELIVASFLRPALPFGPGDNDGYRAWYEAVGERWRQQATAETGEEWYARRNLERGSAATFAAAVIDDDACWCVAVGDCCLFVLRGDAEPACLVSFPIRSWTEFDATPHLVRTDDLAWPRWTRFRVAPGDVIVGASDGVAEWVLAAAVEHPEVWRLLAEITAREFAAVVDEERRIGTMVDDDAAIVRLVVEPPP